MATVRTIICGSPQVNGKSAAAANRLAGLLRRRFPQDEVRVYSVAQSKIYPCVGCGMCAKLGKCAIHDLMDEVLKTLAESSCVFVISPIYFAGPPSQLKALLDRLQPMYYTDARFAPKRPAHLVAIGDGGDPHGFDPLVICCRSALSVSGFSLDSVTPCIGMSKRKVFSCIDDLVSRVFGDESESIAAIPPEGDDR